MVTLRPGPAPMTAEEYGRPEKYYGYLGEATSTHIILENGPFPSPAPYGEGGAGPSHDAGRRVGAMRYPPLCYALLPSPAS